MAVAQLNARFAEGRPSNALERVGVLVHQFDSYDDGNDHRLAPWEQCPLGDCRASSDRISVVSVGANSTPDEWPRWKYPRGPRWPLFSSSLAGLILSPVDGRNRLLCSYPYDAGTSDRQCRPLGVSASCVPGCIGSGGWRSLRWCTEVPGWPCAWPPDHLQASLEIRERIAASRGQSREYDVDRNFVREGGYYNELVFEFAAFNRSLPESIAAVFYIAGGKCDDNRPQWWIAGSGQFAKCEAYARWAYAQLQARWPSRAVNIPLVELDIYDFSRPFRRAFTAVSADLVPN